MAIQLDNGNTATRIPVIKRGAIGETFIGAVVRFDQRDMIKDNEKVINDRTGKPRQELVVTCIALPGTTAEAGIRDERAVPTPGDLVRVILRGKSFADWIEARRGHRGGALNVGDTLATRVTFAQAYDASGRPRGGEITDQATVDDLPRGTTVGFYGPLAIAEPKDQAWVAKAEAAYREATAIQLDATPHGPAPAVDDDPFAGLV